MLKLNKSWRYTDSMIFAVVASLSPDKMFPYRPWMSEEPIDLSTRGARAEPTQPARGACAEPPSQ